MPSIQTRRLCLAFAAAVLVAVSSGRAQAQGFGQKVGEKVDEAASAVRRGVDRAGETVREQFIKVKASINALGVEGRVYSRIHWDKALEHATVDVAVSRDGTVTLSGTVADPAARDKAVQIAVETVGVVRVVEQLTLISSTSPPKP